MKAIPFQRGIFVTERKISVVKLQLDGQRRVLIFVRMREDLKIGVFKAFTLAFLYCSRTSQFRSL